MEQLDFRQVIARNVRVARAAKGISQEALADEAGVNRSYMSRVERGVTWVGVEILVKLAVVLEVEPHELLMPPPPRRTRLAQDRKD
jgi:transcriptional regulator with XRE-family HTH domain